MKYKLFPVLFFNHSIQSSPPPMAKLKSLHGVLIGQPPTQKSSHPYVACPHMMTSKSSQPPPPTNMLFQSL